MTDRGMLELRPLKNEQLAERMSEYRQRIAPIVRKMLDIEALRRYRYILHPNGEMECEKMALPADLEKALEECQSMIKSIQRVIFSDYIVSSEEHLPRAAAEIGKAMP